MVMNVFVFIVLVILLYLIYILWQQIEQQKRQPKSKLDRSLDRQLLTMLGGDRQAALRLLRHARRNNPGRSYLWYHEKVSRDLSRDRR